MRKSLEGIRVLDLTTFMTGPFASMVLGDLGAEIIKIEPPGTGDNSRQIPPYFHEGESLYYISLNRNKKSMTLNLRKDKGREIFYELVKKADVVIDNYRPGITTKLKVDYESLKAVNPRVICCSITSFGIDGPYSNRPGYDLTIQAMSGAMSMTGEEGRGPMRLGVPMGDLGGSMWALTAIQAALFHREKTGEGQFVDVSLLESLAAFITYPALYYSHAGEMAKPLGSGHQAIVPFQAFKTKDYYMAIACAAEKFWGLLCDALDIAEIKSDPRFQTMADRLKNKDELNSLLSDIFIQKTSAEWDEILSREGVPCAPVNTIDRVFEDPAIRHRSAVISVDHFGEKFRSFGNPIKMTATPIEEYKTPPLLGENNQEILTQLLNYAPGDIEQLKKEGVL